jgi:hypothetical protein
VTEMQSSDLDQLSRSRSEQLSVACAGHIQGLRRVRDPTVETRENMAMEIKHSETPVFSDYASYASYATIKCHKCGAGLPARLSSYPRSWCMKLTSQMTSSPRYGAFAPFVRATPQSDPWRRDRGRIVS